MLHSVEIGLRGRGVRAFDVDEPLIVSQGGCRLPIVTPAHMVRPGDYVGVHHGGAWPQRAARLPSPDPRPLRGSEKAIRYPDEMSESLAFLLGAYLAEGHTTRSNWSVILTNSVMDVLERAQRAWAEVFGLDSRITRQPGRCTGLVVSSKRLVEYMDRLGCGSRASNKRVPEVIASGRKDHVLVFLQGVALDGYTTQTGASKWAICLESQPAIRELQDIVTRLGVVSAQIPKRNQKMQKTYYELYAAGQQGQELCRMVPFLEPDKQRAADAYVGRQFGASWTDVIPGIAGQELYRLIPAGRSGRNGQGTGRQAFRYLCDPRTRHVTRASVCRAADAGAPLPEWLKSLLAKKTVFVPVVSDPVSVVSRCGSGPRTKSALDSSPYSAG